MRVLTLIKYSEHLGPPPASFGEGMARDLPRLDELVTIVDSRSLLPTAAERTSSQPTTRSPSENSSRVVFWPTL